MAERREFDLIVWGATGFTGALVAEYLAGRYGTGGSLNWAIAGRNPEKLGQLKARLNVPDLPAIEADSNDREALDALAARTRVMLTTVGPYARLGESLLAACVAAGTDYCDLCAEVHWMRRMMDRYETQARQTGARVIHSCGFDSIPSDLGLQTLQEQVKANDGAFCRTVTMVVKAARGGASGGTAASIVNLVRETRDDREARRYVAMPYSLNPQDRRKGPRVYDQQGPKRFAALGVWTAPFIMGISNTRVVRRSVALADFPYGEDFVYEETLATGRGFAGWLKAVVVSAGLAAFLLAASFSPTRRLLERFVLPKPGEGPDERARENGFFNLVHVGTLPDGSVRKLRVTGDRDPGYGSTSRMIAETAVCLAKDGIEADGGFPTTATALGASLRQRLEENAGLRFEMMDR